jgi:DNA processing protein
MKMTTPQRHPGLTSDHERAAYLALALVPGIGPARLTALKQACSTWSGALSAPFAFLCTIPGISRAAATAITGTSREAGDRVFADISRRGAVVLLPGDAAFPPRLQHVDPPPAALFAQGNLELLLRPAVAIVGSREHSPDGAHAARAAALAAAKFGCTVVSGMARGLDAIAHAAALDAGVGTIGVLGNGLGVVYPAANRMLYDRVIRDGLLLTELPPGERPHAGSFPRRNRLVAGLADVTVVAEAGHESGALITARLANDLGRAILAAPGAISNPCCAGSNALLRDSGAAPFLDAGDIAGALGDLLAAVACADAAKESWRTDRQCKGAARTEAERSLPERSREVLALCTGVPAPLESLLAATGLSLARLLAELGSLEAAGLVTEKGAQRWVRC